MKIVKLGSIAVMALCLTGCYNMRTNVNESLDKCTFGESCEHYFLFAHDCRRSPEKCNPICRRDLDKFAKSKLMSEKNWNKFKTFNPAIYQFKLTGLVLFDDINPIVKNLAFQIKHEIVIPYIELDKDGLISTYNMFIEDVKITQNIHKETTGKELDFKTACQTTYKFWQNKYGEEQCSKLFAAFPVLKSLSAKKQLCTAVERNAFAVAKLVLRAKRGAEQLKHEAKDWKGITKITAAGLDTFGALNELGWTIAYLSVHLNEKSVAAAHVEEYIKQFKTGTL